MQTRARHGMHAHAPSALVGTGLQGGLFTCVRGSRSDFVHVRPRVPLGQTVAPGISGHLYSPGSLALICILWPETLGRATTVQVSRVQRRARAVGRALM